MRRTGSSSDDRVRRRGVARRQLARVDWRGKWNQWQGGKWRVTGGHRLFCRNSAKSAKFCGRDLPPQLAYSLTAVS